MPVARTAIPGLLVALGCASCEEPRKPTFLARVVVESDPGVPLARAEVVRDGNVVGTTDARGRADVSFVGAEGDAIELRIRCPEAYESPGPLSVRMRRVVDEKVPEYVLACPPRFRNVVVAVRAANGSGLPVIHLGRAIARTDVFGVAHALINAKPGETIDLTLDTSERPRLRPQNPSTRYVVKTQDDTFIFEQKFAEEKPPPPVVHKPHVPRPIPTR